MTGRILVVDDVEQNVKLLEAKLSSEYYTVYSAYSGQECLDMIQAYSPDVVLLDVMMPEMDGFEMCRQLKADPKTADIPILFITGLEDDESRTIGYRLGAVDYVNKPLKQDEVLARAEVHIHNGMLHYTGCKVLEPFVAYSPVFYGQERCKDYIEEYAYRLRHWQTDKPMEFHYTYEFDKNFKLKADIEPRSVGHRRSWGLLSDFSPKEMGKCVNELDFT